MIYTYSHDFDGQNRAKTAAKIRLHRFRRGNRLHSPAVVWRAHTPWAPWPGTVPPCDPDGRWGRASGPNDGPLGGATRLTLLDQIVRTKVPEIALVAQKTEIKARWTGISEIQNGSSEGE